MKTLKFVLFVTLAAAFGCSSGGGTNPEQPAPNAELSAADDDIYIFGNPLETEQLKRGRWEIRNGSRICHGYLTRKASEDFCAETIPDDWHSFTYNGQTYYVQPLAGS